MSLLSLHSKLHHETESKTLTGSTPVLRLSENLKNRLNTSKLKKWKKGRLNVLTGIIRRAVQVSGRCLSRKDDSSDEIWVEEILSYSSRPMPLSILKLHSRKQICAAINLFRHIKDWERAFVDRNPVAIDLFDKIHQLVWGHYDLQDELYLLVFKQIRHNPNPLPMWHLLHLVSNNLHCSEEVRVLLRESLEQFGLLGEASGRIKSLALKTYNRLKEQMDCPYLDPGFEQAETELRESIFPIGDRDRVKLLALQLQATLSSDVFADKMALADAIPRFMNAKVIESRTLLFWADNVMNFVKENGLRTRREAQSEFKEAFRSLRYRDAFCVTATVDGTVSNMIGCGKEIVIAVLRDRVNIYLEQERLLADSISMHSIKGQYLKNDKLHLFVDAGEGSSRECCYQTISGQSVLRTICDMKGEVGPSHRSLGENADPDTLLSNSSRSLSIRIGRYLEPDDAPSASPLGPTTPDPFNWTAKYHNTEEELDEDGLEKEVLHALSSLKPGDCFLQRYFIQEDEVRDKPHILFAKDICSKDNVTLKFYSNLDHFRNSTEYHSKLTSPHICSCYHASRAQDGFPPFMVMERGLQTLEEWMKRFHYKQDCRAVLYQVLKAIEFIHDRGIVHGDLKPQNIMKFYPEDIWKIIDFDTATKLSDQTQFGYTIAYAAPEVIGRGERGDDIAIDTSIDMWSFGVIAFEVLNNGMSRVSSIQTNSLSEGTRFYESKASGETIAEKLLEGSVEISLQAMGDVEGMNFVSQLVQTDPKMRISAKEALSHPIFRVASETEMKRAGRYDGE